MEKIQIIYFVIVLVGIITCTLLGTTDDNLENGRKRPFLLIPTVVYFIQLMGCVHFYIFPFVSEQYNQYILFFVIVLPLIANLLFYGLVTILKIFFKEIIN